MTVKERIKLFISYLELTNQRFEVECGLSNGYIANMRKGVGDDALERISNKYPQLSRSWLLTGEGEMLKSELPVGIITSDKGIPYYDMDVTASITESFNDIRAEALYFIDYPPFGDCDAAFPVFGDSMEPDFYSGETILVKRINNINSMLWGEPYLVITNGNCDNLRTIKNVYLSDDRSSFILRAINPRYKGDTVVPCEDVVEILLVKGKINRRQL